MNKEILVIVTYFVAILGLLSVVISTGVTFVPNMASVNNIPNYGVQANNGLSGEMITINGNQTINTLASQCNNGQFGTGTGPISFTQLITAPSPWAIATSDLGRAWNTLTQSGVGYAGSNIYILLQNAASIPFAAIAQLGQDIFGSGQSQGSKTTGTNSTGVSGLGCQLNTQSGFVAYNPTTFTSNSLPSANDVLTETLIIAGAFVALGLLAGTLGAGQLAYIIASVGIGLSFAFYVFTIPTLPNPNTGLPYFNLPLPLAVLFGGINAVMVIWLIWVNLRG